MICQLIAVGGLTYRCTLPEHLLYEGDIILTMHEQEFKPPCGVWHHWKDDRLKDPDVYSCPALSQSIRFIDSVNADKCAALRAQGACPANCAPEEEQPAAQNVPAGEVEEVREVTLLYTYPPFGVPSF